MNYFSLLPLELHAEIFGLLALADVCSSACVCKEWEERVWVGRRTLVFAPFPRVDKATLSKILPICSSSLLSLDLFASKDLHDDSLELLSYCPNITHLNLAHW
eukprot:TRINITY_DN4033_c0_g1_i2.p2 TRINITY_DN4033_c0_g1~~TRINITY_DN4033_c0_g1_i2.p2  ORF type:complete len:103 (-),score=3.50 TRINITY_DN4033_c0_g1_i2:198-506(-)